MEACVLDGVSPVASLVWLTLLSDPGLEDDAESSSSSTRKETAGLPFVLVVDSFYRTFLLQIKGF